MQECCASGTGASVALLLLLLGSSRLHLSICSRRLLCQLISGVFLHRSNRRGSSRRSDCLLKVLHTIITSLGLLRLRRCSWCAGCRLLCHRLGGLLLCSRRGRLVLRLLRRGFSRCRLLCHCRRRCLLCQGRRLCRLLCCQLQAGKLCLQARCGL